MKKKNLHKKLVLKLGLLLSFLFFFAGNGNVFSQVYEMTLNQRRAYDQIHVEIWAKGLPDNGTVPKMGSASLVVQYNTAYLRPAAVQSPATTDSISRDIDQVDPIIDISSQFNNLNGYSGLGTQAYSTSGYYSLEVNLQVLGELGLVPSSNGRGSFIGKSIFDIIDDPADTSLTEISWSQSGPGTVEVFDVDGNNLVSQGNVTLSDPGDFTVLGITILSPNFANQVVDRDQNYASLTGDYAQLGYPIYFERSIDPNNDFTPPVDENLGYVFEYSLDNGDSWTEFGRVAETDQSSSAVGSDDEYRSGEIANPSTGTSYLVSSQDETQLDEDNYRNPVRVIWAKNNFFTSRSEEARLRISMLNGDITQQIIMREKRNEYDINDIQFILGRLFFLQLDGTSQYLKSTENFSNATQLTVEAWVNLNSINQTIQINVDDEEVDIPPNPGIVVSSGGPDATEIRGSKEGAWMLYLYQGRYPAFRVREIQDRGPDGYLAHLIAYDPLPVESDASPLSSAHADNWVHVAATVDNNIVTLYVDGEIVERYENDYATDIRMLTTDHPLWIGVNPTDQIYSNRYLNAGLKQIRIWRNALTQEEIRRRVGGVVDPATIANYDDLRKGLEMYYTLEGNNDDSAIETYYQNGEQFVDYHINGTVDNDALQYRPDQPHIKLTAPDGGVGVLNKEDDLFNIRWVHFGLGDIANALSDDIAVEYSIDYGNSWYSAKDNNDNPLVGMTAPDVENASAIWEPYLNNDPAANLRTVTPFSRDVLLRIRGTETYTQSDLMFVTDTFKVAPYFSLRKSEGSIISLKGDDAPNFTGNTAFIEAWIRPYRFPTDEEGFMPLLIKMDSITRETAYSMNLLPTGQLEFNLWDADGNKRTATSNSFNVLTAPNSMAIDTPWVHVGAYLFFNSGTGQSEIRFYIDGIVQRADSIATQLGTDLLVDPFNDYPLYIGYYPGVYDEEAEEFTDAIRGFAGEVREIRVWSGIPDNVNTSGTEPTELTKYVQGAANVNGKDILSDNRDNLLQLYSLNGTSYIVNGYNRAIGNTLNPGIVARFYGEPISYQPIRPYIKLVEPTFKQQVANTDQSVRIRWVGFNYDGVGFYPGASSVPPSLEYSIRGGGGDIIQPYQYVGSNYWSGNTENSFTIPSSDSYIFRGTGEDVYFASNLNASIADPDEDNDGSFTQGPLAASLTNARLRLTGEYTINENPKQTIRTEGPLFTVTPASNFTIRVLLEGYHDGDVNGDQMRDIGSTFDEGGLRIILFEDNAGTIGPQLATSESYQGYSDLDPANKNGGNDLFGNVNYIFTSLSDDNYWVVVTHPNHLPVMSRFAAPFYYEGDVPETWSIESGWDFSSWDGEDNNVLPDVSADPWSENYFTAYGYAYSTETVPEYSETALVYNNGPAGGETNALPAMVGGDVDQSGQISAADRVQVRQDEGTGLVRSDVTGDGFVNADDRTITDRNFGKVSSIYDLNLTLNMIEGGAIPADAGISEAKPDPYSVISELDPELSKFFNENANRSKPIKNKRIETIFGGFDYVVTAEPVENGNYIDLEFYIENRGDEFGLANCTFAVNYNSSSMRFETLMGAQDVLYHDKPEVGYAELSSAPEEGIANPLPDVRTIEVDYDAYANLGGLPVPYEKTYLGTLRFAIKDSTAPITFEWHESTSVHTTKAEIVTPYGVFRPIESILSYDAEIVSPNGGESLNPDKKFPVRWTSDGSAQILLEYTINDGEEWLPVMDHAIDANNLEYEWMVPNVTSDECLVRILDQETGYELDRSDDLFSIQNAFAMIIRPSSGDPVYTGGKTEKIKWVNQGYNKIYFEFSSDNGNTWAKVTGQLDGSLQETNWTVPKVTTKTALMRMIDVFTGQEVARSSMFKILGGSLDLLTPRGGEILIYGRNARIRWTHNNVPSFDMYISYNGGIDWELLDNEVNAKKTYFDWSVPNRPTEEAIIRAIWMGDFEMEYDRTDRFIIKSLVSVEDDAPAGFEFGQPQPNPANEETKIDFNLPAPQYIDVTLIDQNGKEVKKVEMKLYPAGKNTCLISTAGLSSGTYYVVFRGDKFNITRALKVVR